MTIDEHRAILAAIEEGDAAAAAAAMHAHIVGSWSRRRQAGSAPADARNHQAGA
jgi:DNA-binding GntR family transcriptional regulator